jgi:hypothetical protein
LKLGVPVPAAFACGGIGDGESYHFKDIGWWHLKNGICADNLHKPRQPEKSEIEKFNYCVKRLGIKHKYSLPEKWNDIETQLRNALAEVRGDVSSAREVKGCSLYWKNRIVQCYSEKDILRRQDALDKVWWDAAGELIDLVSPLGKGALFAYAVRLKIALNRSNISTQLGSLILEKCLKEDSK